MRSQKEYSMDKKIIRAIKALELSEKVHEAAKLLMTDEEIQAIQEYANHVSIVRLGYNDHGPVHMRTVVYNVILMLGLLRQAGIKTSFENEGIGSFEDSLLGAMFAAMLHDLGMSVGRHEHEIHSASIAAPIIDRVLMNLYPDNLNKRIIIRSLALEGISGHMGSRAIHTLEAGVVQVADGCDMTKGRARIPIALGNTAMTGSIHKFSANSIESVVLSQGKKKPISIEVSMSSEAGLFQIEEVLMHKIASSTAKPYIELYAKVIAGTPSGSSGGEPAGGTVGNSGGNSDGETKQYL